MPSKKSKPSGLRRSTFLKAAERLASRISGYACNGLYDASFPLRGEDDWTEKRDRLPEVVFFCAVLRPRNGVSVGAWYSDSELLYEELNNARIFGLLLCAELIRDGFTLADFPPATS